MTNEKLEEFHRIAMDNAELALIALHNNDIEKFQALSAEAFFYEKKAALGLYNEQIEPSRSILFRSAAYIALDNADFSEAQKLYEYALDGDIPGEMKEELEELKTEIDRIKTENESLIQNTLTFLNTRPRPIKKEEIEADVTRASRAFESKEINWKYVYSYLEKQFSIEAEKHITINEKDTYEPWVHNKKGIVKKRFWERYINYLQKEKEWAPDTLDKLDDITDDILDHLKDPTSKGDWDKKGLVVGQVQSGKTSNYTGLICKAADYGFKIIVVLAGTTNDLRSQTQLRIDEGFLGWDTKVDREGYESRHFGVSKYDSSPQAHYFTTSAIDGDFKTTARHIIGTNPRSGHIIVIVKKHPTILKEFIRWFAERGENQRDGKTLVKKLPLLLIDDEADNASINVSPQSISTINGLIRSLLSLFQQSAYVGYTATPFANVFIPLTEEENHIPKGLNIQLNEFWKYSGKDLFPKDFIINIPPPSNYIGPKEIFGIDTTITTNLDEVKGLPLIREFTVDTYQKYYPDKHKKDDTLPEELPEKLKEAIKSFILVCAIRRVRGQIDVHNSMLIHVTRFIKWQNKTATLVNRLLKFYQQQIQYKQGTLISELKQLYNRDFVVTTEIIKNIPDTKDSSIYKVEWFEIETQLRKAVSKIQVRAIHGDKTQDGLEFDNITSLDYYDHRKRGLSVIAIGGNKLSRGLTLEGLSVSYYLRATKMYDTLMQMGRWFGYRPGYLDLCRLYTSEDLVKWYKYITVASEELRNEFEDMKMERKSPKEFGIKVRQDPDVLQITATNKMKSSQEMELTFSDKLRETWCFRRNRNLFEDNFKHTHTFINSLGAPNKKNGQEYVWYKTGNYQDVIRFLKGYVADNKLEHEKIIEYITQQVTVNFLTNWTIVLISNKNKQQYSFKIENEDTSIGTTMRTDANKGNGNYYEVNRSHIIDPTHEFIDFDTKSHTYTEALHLTIEDWKKSERKNKSKKQPTIPSGKNIRAKRAITEGLLLIYPLDPKPNGWENSSIDVPLIGYAISFPKNENDKKIKYRVNQVFMDEYEYDDDIELEEIDLQ
ncbi:Z1 domain-containing protein [Chryseobacterium gallinarum]|uniref:Z1 domain-containing protein n=1 Tax=Chryseobacterium gallinarum TaxID=1324352 RepID=UPI0006A6D334|nr:Z1 domain-containing protein [Chryseobacterium gallinarum]